MKAVVLAATHERALNAAGRQVPRPLLDLEEEPLLTRLTRRLDRLPQLDEILVVTNEALRPEMAAWAEALPATRASVRLLSDGTRRPEERLGAVGDLRFAVMQAAIRDDLLVIGGDNWFLYDLGDFVERARTASPAVVVTPLGSRLLSSRFGMVALDEAGRIVRFEEKPETSDLTLKASCVYFFAARDLLWLDGFARERSTVCSPGELFAWMAERTSCYGVQMAAAWYDIGQAPPGVLRGPDLIEFRNRLRKRISPEAATWDRAAARQLQWVSAAEELLEVLHDDDPNRRILAARLLGGAADLLSDAGRTQAVQALLPLLADGAQNQYAYSGYQGDDESATFVSATAADALAQLGYAPDAAAVFEEARRAGLPVEVRQNVY